MNFTAWYKSPNVWLQLAASIPGILAVAGVAATPVGLGVSAAIGLGLAIYNAATHHTTVTGLQVAVTAANAAAQQLSAATPAGQQ